MLAIELCAAQPSDAQAAVPLIYSSGPAAFDYVFKPTAKHSAESFLYAAFRDGAGEFGYRNHIVAKIKNQVVGIGSAFSGDESTAFFLANARQIFAHYKLNGLRVARNGLQVERVVTLPRAGIHYLAHLGVAPEFRSQGIGAPLVQALLDQGKRAGRTIAELDVAETNPRAQALYEKLGFRVISEQPSNLQNAFARVPAHRRMQKMI